MIDELADDPGPTDADMPPNVTPISRARRARKPKLPAGERTELELAEMLVARFSDDLRYCKALGGWFAWTGTHWQLDEREHARECVKVIARELASEAARNLDEDTFKAAKRAGSANGVAAILDLARSDKAFVFSPDDANRDEWALNVQNGTVDLRTGQLKPHGRADLITRCCNATYDPAATAPTFERFLAEVQPDPDVRSYLARLCGYAAIGIVREHVLGVFWGPGANGKSVLAEVVSHVLGGYAKPGPSTLIVASGHQPHPTDVAVCVGSRLVIVHETQRGATFDASKVKLLTGGDKLTARHMRQDFFEFTPSHTLVMLSNYRPQADATDAALWRRVQLVPFDVVIPEDRRDASLAQTIRNEASGVLRWIVEGALEWQRVGLAPPAVIREQTERYRASEDVIGAFLDESTVKLPAASVKAAELYAAFKKWCEANGQKAANNNTFGEELKARGFERVDRNTGRVYRGIGLRAESTEAEEP